MNTRTWRRVHRYLGFVIGIQLFFWTLSGLIFSWNSIGSVRGEHLVRQQPTVDLKAFELEDVQQILDELSVGESVVAVTLKPMLNRPVYELTIDRIGKSEFVLVDAVSGERLSPINQETAAAIAQNDFADDADVRSVELVESVGSHSEYRGKELPAFRVVMEHPTDTAIYVSANRGAVTTRRSNQWRMFDFFWMLHTMDYQGRDNFNTWLLKSTSIFGLVTVLSGFALWIKTSKFTFRKKNQNARSLNRSLEM